jgi:hypothetical protein
VDFGGVDFGGEERGISLLSLPGIETGVKRKTISHPRQRAYGVRAVARHSVRCESVSGFCVSTSVVDFPPGGETSIRDLIPCVFDAVVLRWSVIVVTAVQSPGPEPQGARGRLAKLPRPREKPPPVILITRAH